MTSINQVIALFRQYQVPVNQVTLVDWYTVTHPNEVEYILNDLGIDDSGVTTVFRSGSPDTNYIKLKLTLLSRYIST